MQNSQDKLLDFAALCLWIIASAAFAMYVFVEYGQDFRGYYAAGRVLLERGNPYDYNQVTPVLIEATGRAGNNPFYYPLWFGWFVAPLSLLPFEMARAVWMFFNWALWLYGLVRLQQALGFPAKGWRGWLLFLLATFIFAWTTWKFEQAGILLFVIMVEIIISYQKQQWTRMGIFMGLALIKPNIMLLPILVLSVWLIRNHKWKPVLVSIGVLWALTLITTVLTPDWYRPFFQPDFGQGLTEVLDGPNQVIGTRVNTTLLDWLKWLSVPDSLRVGIYIIVLITGVWLLWKVIRSSGSIFEIVTAALLAAFVMAPYALQYDFPPLAIVLFVALARLKNSNSRVIAFIIVGFITSVLIWERPISDGYWIVIALTVLMAWAIKAASDRPAMESLPTALE